VRQLLTPREREVVDLIAAGLPYRSIAERLGLSYSTVRTHVAHAMERTGATHAPHLVAIVERERRDA